jgi:hypothetical protein
MSTCFCAFNFSVWRPLPKLLLVYKTSLSPLPPSAYPLGLRGAMLHTPYPLHCHLFSCPLKLRRERRTQQHQLTRAQSALQKPAWRTTQGDPSNIQIDGQRHAVHGQEKPQICHCPSLRSLPFLFFFLSSSVWIDLKQAENCSPALTHA